MARITTYANDTAIATGDKIIGTDAADNSTKNFTVGDLSTFVLRDTITTDNIPEGRSVVSGGMESVVQGRIYQTTTSENNVAIPAGFLFNLARDNSGYVITLTGYGGSVAFPYDVESFIGKTWETTEYATRQNQTITEFLTPPFSVVSNAVVWRFRTTITNPLAIDVAAGTVGRRLTSPVISSLDRSFILVDSGLVNATTDATAATAGVPINGLYRTDSTVKIRVA